MRAAVLHAVKRHARGFCVTALLVVAPAAVHADPQPPELLDGAGIRLALEKLNVAGSALYVAAHPDDENTAALTWLSSGRKVRTAYLSVTRGDGGQNLIGSDVGERLGVIRTQELIAARRIDGAEQFFTRAVDFGFSKNSDETLAIWGRDRILADVVWVIRRFRPDVIVTRFSPEVSGSGHGHHTASAILAEEAFAAAADPARFPDQLAHVKPWQAKRLVWNVGRFGGAGPDTTPGRLSVDLGEYNPLLARSYTEIAGESRSMHKSQGFGAAERRGTWTNSFEHRAGARAAADLFEGVNLTWSRFPGGARLTPILARALKEFRPERPQAIVPILFEAEAILARLGDDPLIEKKRDELRHVIRSCAGLWLEAVALAPAASPGSRVRVVASALNRSDLEVQVSGVAVSGSERRAKSPAASLAFNVPATDTFSVAIPAGARTTEPYWLRTRSDIGAFSVAEQALIGTPENVPAYSATFDLRVAGKPLQVTVPVVYRWVDPVMGERHRAFEIVPPATLRFDHGVYLFAGDRPRALRVTVQSADVPVSGAVSLTLPSGWTSSPERVPVRLRAGEADTTVTFTVTPGAGPAAAAVGATIELESGRHGARLVRLDYPHVPVQTLLPPAEARLVRTDLRIAGRAAGYVMGSGDQGAEALEEMGYEVAMLDDDDLEHADLSRYDVIVVGVRAYNTRPRLRVLNRRLLDYVAAGGRMVVQYQTAEQSLQDRLGPFPFRISRERVTVEEAPVTMPKPDHPVLVSPNRIGDADFAGWVQERGLYFASPWDERYEAPLSSHDPGEPARDGGLIVARHGRGTFLYTGYAFFRQLPAGVPGAWRLFANLVSPGPAERGTNSH